MNKRRQGRETVHQDTALMQGNPQIQTLRDAVEAYFATCENVASDQARANRMVIQARTLPNGISAVDLLQEFRGYLKAADVLNRIASSQATATPALAFNDGSSHAGYRRKKETTEAYRSRWCHH